MIKRRAVVGTILLAGCAQFHNPLAKFGAVKPGMTVQDAFGGLLRR